MKQPYQFTYKSLEDIQGRSRELGVYLPLSKNTSVLGMPINIGGNILHNRLGIAPMEGVDSEPDGSPGELTFRRYQRFARGGAGLIWFEAVCIVPEGRSSLKQLLLTKDNLPAYQRLNDQIKEEGMKANGFAPYLVMQSNHSGRYSRPNPTSTPQPMTAFHNPYLERIQQLDDNSIVTDDYLKRLEEIYGESAFLAKKAGFDAVDIKCCHGYLLGELTAAFTRKGPYGGSFENRTRLLVNAIRNAQQAQDKNFQVLSRVGIYDNIPYPYGFGMTKDSNLTPDLEEPVKLIAILANKLHVPFINLTMGDPHYDAYVTRPFNLDVNYLAGEDPLIGVSRSFKAARTVKKKFPHIQISASAPSYLRHFSASLAAGAVQAGACDHVCFGRMSFAYPDFPNDIIQRGCMDPHKSCVTCGKCSELIRAGHYTGCPIHDKEVYLPAYQALLEKTVPIGHYSK